MKIRKCIKKQRTLYGIMAVILILFNITTYAATLVDYTNSTLTVDTPQLSAGDAIQARDINCQNDIVAPPGPKYTAIYISENPTVTRDDRRLSTHPVTTRPGTCSEGKFWALMSFASEGIYYVRTFIDYRDSVIESNEHNNGSPVQTIEIINGQADINVEMTRSPANAMPGQSITVGSVLCNPGTRKTGDFTIGLYLSYDVTIDDQDTLLGSTRKTLYNGQCSGVNSITLSGTLPTNLVVGGDYFLVVKVDTENEVTESNENKNQTVG